MLSRIREDVRAMRRRDPAARGDLEVFLCYPGLHAVWFHVFLAAPLYAAWPLAGRLVSQFARFGTGVEIHPGADVGRRVTIDHGAGVVVGETAEIGDDVHMYHGVTLGGDNPEPVKRHPTVRPGATLGANATLLGDIEIGENSSVGAGSVVTRDVPAGATVAGVPAERVDAADVEA
ncbi:serine O-acetyltransferase [Halobacterium litoreum]|uniref:Serine acetyltransferase n=1 Tax=Halobacterium litoreum TaxID=2039234 RepID=A0ABD5NDB8_9EURY|nr:serine O-acetyltransferase [Halobacterium litoreum]UHH14168.1 serine O-acetyltransferase [Halobacterium litoreum]